MDDSISRQAAIETIKKHYRVDNDLLEVIAYEIEALPSAQLAQDLPNGCTDTISRKGVLSLLDAVPSEEFATKAMLISGVNALPSAQPVNIAKLQPNCNQVASDCISRQAALDAMETWDKFGCDPDGKLVKYDDDKHYIPYVHYEDMVHAIKHLPPAQPGWIPVTERLPEYGTTVLTCNHDGEYEINHIIDEEDGEWFWDGAVAWMPLPTPYREGGQS